MTPPDQPDEQPSALSRLERALAGFGDPTRTTPEPEAEAPAPAPEPDPPAVEADDDVEEWEPAPVESSSVLDIASAVDAIERLSAAQGAEEVSAIEALEKQWAQEDDEHADEVQPRFEPADLRSRIKEFEEADAPDAIEEVGAVAEAEAGLPEAVAEEFADEPLEDAAPPARVTDAAASWERNLGDTSLPYFLVEDNRAVGAESPRVPPTIEELRAALPIIEQEHKQASVLRTLLEIPILLIVAALIAFLVKSFLAQAYYIPSGSMLPQLKVDDRVVVSKLAYKAHDPRRGDIIVFDDPRPGAPDKSDESFIRKVGEGIGIVQPSTDEFIKRVVGLPGETVEGRDNHVYINGHRLYEPYLTDDVVTTDFPKTTIKAGHLWVMGDNRSNSADSRVFGQIDIDTIVGRAVVTVWPFGNAEFL